MIEGLAEGRQASLAGGALFGRGGKLLETHAVMPNGIRILPEKQLTTRVNQGDSVTIYLPVSGG